MPRCPILLAWVRGRVGGWGLCGGCNLGMKNNPIFKMKKILTTCFFLMLTVFVFAQKDTLTTEQIKDLIELSKYSKTWNSFLNVWAILGPLLAVFFTYLGIKNKIEKWGEDEVTKKANEKFGVDWKVVKEIVDRHEKEKSVKQSRILIINKNGDRKQSIVAALKSGGFIDDTKISAQSVTAFPQSIINANNQDVVIFDNEDGDFKEHEIIPFVQNLKGQTVKMICYTTDDWLAFKTYSGADYNLKFAKLPNLIADRIKQAFGL